MTKNRRLLSYSIFILCILIALTYSCKKDDNNNQIKDFDGNIYTSVTIGTQVWMLENLKTTHFNDGTPILNPVNNEEWPFPTFSIEPAYCWYNSDPKNKPIYGAIYNFYAVKTGKLAPKGWHVPTDAEWDTLTAFLGGVVLAGGKMKEAGNSHWLMENIDATNTSGFTGLPGGVRMYNGVFESVGYVGNWWSSTETEFVGYYAGRQLSYWGGFIERLEATPMMGFSVRCIKD